MAATSVDAYLSDLPPATAALTRALAALVREGAPGAQEAIKWGQPVWTQGGPAVWLKAHTKHVNLGFWRGADMEDPQGLLVGEGERMKHLKFDKAEQIDRELVLGFVRQAIVLNAEKGDPTRRKAKG